MKKLLSIVFICIILANCAFVVSAEELYEVDGYPRAFFYNQYVSDGRLDLSCYDYNVEAKTSQASWTGVLWHNYLEEGQSYWSRRTSVSNNTIPNNYISCRTTSSNQAHVWYAIPTTTSWGTLVQGEFMYTCYAVTDVFDTNGVEITQSNVSTVNNLIRSGNIYFNPVLASGIVNQCNNTQYAAACTVAHELGHVLGFGHLRVNVASIMESDIKQYEELQDYDLGQLRVKYSNRIN